jgi:hypothetical protein
MRAIKSLALISVVPNLKANSPNPQFLASTNMSVIFLGRRCNHVMPPFGLAACIRPMPALVIRLPGTSHYVDRGSQSNAD